MSDSNADFKKNADFFTRQILLASAYYSGKPPPSDDTSDVAQLMRLGNELLPNGVKDMTRYFLDPYEAVDRFDRGVADRRQQVTNIQKDLSAAVEKLDGPRQKAVVAQLARLANSPEVMATLDTGNRSAVTLTRGEATVRGATADIVQPVNVAVDTLRLDRAWVNKLGGIRVGPGGSKI